MSKRFYICPVREISTDPDDPTDVSWKPIVFKYLRGHPGTANVAAMTTLGADTWALVKMDFIDDKDHGTPTSDTEIDAIPNIEVDNVLSVGDRGLVQGIFAKYGVTGIVKDSEKMRGLLGRIAKKANPSFIQDDWF